MLDSLQTNDPVLVIIAFFVVLIPLILVHELGHFLAAKAVGITILEFGIGFPPRIRKLFTWRETEFTLNWIPLGGFVRPLGEDMIRPLDEKAVEEDRQELISRQSAGNQSQVENAKSVNEAKPLGRIFFMAAGALANFLLAILLFIVVALLGIPQIVGGSVAVIDVKADSAMGKAGLQSGDIITEIDGQKFTTSADYLTHYYQANSPVTFKVQREGVQNPIELQISPAGNSAPTNPEYALVLGVVQDTPADKAGIKPGDIVVALNEATLAGVDDLKNRTAENAGKEISLTVERGTETFEVRLTPRENPPQGQGAMGIVINKVWADAANGLMYTDGFLQQDVIPLTIGEAVNYSLNKSYAIIATTVSLPSKLIRGETKPEEARPVSVLGMSQIGGTIIQESLQQGRIAPILDFIATISVALGFFNLLPIPALDGGRIVFVLVEIVRGRPIAPEREGLVHLIGLALLLSLSVLVILNDVIHPITNTIR